MRSGRLTGISRNPGWSVRLRRLAAGGGPGRGGESRTSWGAPHSPPLEDATDGGRGPSRASVSWDKILGCSHRGGSSEIHTFVAASGDEMN